MRSIVAGADAVRPGSRAAAKAPAVEPFDRRRFLRKRYGRRRQVTLLIRRARRGAPAPRDKERDLGSRKCQSEQTPKCHVSAAEFAVCLSMTR